MNKFLTTLKNRNASVTKVDTGFSVSARCIFVYKNNLAPHLRRRSERGKASELGFPESPDLIQSYVQEEG